MVNITIGEHMEREMMWPNKKPETSEGPDLVFLQLILVGTNKGPTELLIVFSYDFALVIINY